MTHSLISPVGASPRARHWWRVLAGLLVSALLAYSVVSVRLHGDIRYVLACLRSGEAVGISPSEVFTHRPYFYRWFLYGLDQLTVGPIAVREALLRLAGVTLCAACGMALRAALLRRLPAREATVTAVMVALALAFAPRTDFLQPEWTAVVLAVLAVAAVLAVERPLPAAALAALPLGLAVMMKYSTAATAVMALLVVFAADRRRAALLGAATAVSGTVLLAFSLWQGSHEWQWIRDMPQINQGALSRQGIHPEALFDRSLDFVADRASLSPVLVLLPAAFALLLVQERERRRRAEWSALLALLLAVGLGAVVVQGNWFAYHAAALPVGGAALWGLAVARWSARYGRPPFCFAVLSVLLAVGGMFVSEAPPELQRPAVVWVTALACLGAVVLDVRAAERAPRVPAALAVLMGTCLLAVTVWPGAPHQMNRGKVQVTNAAYLRTGEAKAQRAAEVRRQLPDGALVQYLAFGDEAYFVGHASPCRYPIPTFLQRVRYLPDVRSLDSHVENARCLEEDPPRYAVLQRSWFPLGQIDRSVAARVERLYDCPDGPREALVVCRLR
ncbi:hypothetical protein ACFWFI_04435 [Streptomyces sp. NPDC060209]|uniref:hypothetical protein n=1 Tax=Streptomyces sp. NPDC060209 TaxID=3347073 RepID=UPI00365E3501